MSPGGTPTPDPRCLATEHGEPFLQFLEEMQAESRSIVVCGSHLDDGKAGPGTGKGVRLGIDIAGCFTSGVVCVYEGPGNRRKEEREQYTKDVQQQERHLPLEQFER